MTAFLLKVVEIFAPLILSLLEKIVRGKMKSLDKRMRKEKMRGKVNEANIKKYHSCKELACRIDATVRAFNGELPADASVPGGDSVPPTGDK